VTPAGGKSYMRRGKDCNYDKGNTPVVICNIDIP
jgi:hypothetical protein